MKALLALTVGLLSVVQPVHADIRSCLGKAIPLKVLPDGMFDWAGEKLNRDQLRTKFETAYRFNPSPNVQIIASTGRHDDEKIRTVREIARRTGFDCFYYPASGVE